MDRVRTRVERARRRGYRPKERGEKGQTGKRGRMSDKVWMCRQNAEWMCRASQDTRALVRFTELGFNYSLSILQEQILQEPSAGKERWE